MLQTKRVPGRKDVVAVSWDGPTEIYLRKSGREFFGKEECLCRFEDGDLVVNRKAAEKFGIGL